MMDKFGDMMNMIKQVQQKVAETQQLLETERIEVTSGETLKIVINGQQVIEKIEINTSYLTPESGPILQDLLVATMNKALAQSKEKYSEAMGHLAEELNLPKIPGLF